MSEQATETGGTTATTVTAIPAKGPPPAPGAARAAKLASVSQGLSKLIAAEKAPSASAAVEVEAPAPTPATKPLETEAETPSEETAADPKPAAEPKPPAEDDLQTKRGLAAVDRAKKQLLEEKQRAKADLEAERADIARERAELKKNSTTHDELRTIAKRDPLEALRRLGYAKDDDEEAWEHVGRSAFPLTKAGKTDPRTREAAERAIRERGSSTKLDAALERIEKLESELQERDKRAQFEGYARSWTDQAVKAIPETPTLIGKLHAKSPDKARSALLKIGAQLEKELGGEPSHADAIAEYERVRREELEEQGVDVDAMLRPTTSATATKAAPSKTLDVAQPATGTKPINGATTRSEKLSAASKGLQKLWASGEQP